MFHLAAQSYPMPSFDAPIETLTTNILGTANLLEALRKSVYKRAITHVCASSEVFGRVPAEKLPEASRATTFDAVLVVVASTANVRTVAPV